MKTSKSFAIKVLVIAMAIVLIIPSAFARIGFNEIVVTDSLPGACAAQAADLTGDGSMEIVAVSWDHQRLSWYEEISDGNWNEFTLYDVEEGFFRYVLACDLDRDQDVDIVASGAGSNGIHMWLNQGNGLFFRVPITTAYGGCHTLTKAYMNPGDAAEILATGFVEDRVLLMMNDGEAGFTEETISESFTFSTSIFATDLDSDGDQDIVACGYTSGTILWWENDGEFNFTEHELGTQTRIHWITSGDYDQDGDIDIAGAAYANGNVSIWWNDGEETFERERIDLEFVGASFITSGDMDNDTDMDIVASDELLDQVAWYENDGSGEFTKHLIVNDLDRVMSDELIDYDGDGDLDIITTAVDDGKVTIWENGINDFTPTPFTMLQPVPVDTIPYDWPLYIRWEQSFDEDPEARLKYMLSFRGLYLTIEMPEVDLFFESDTFYHTTILDVWPDLQPFFGMSVECYVTAISQGDTLQSTRMSNLYFDPAMSVNQQDVIPDDFEVKSIYPNPFNSTANLNFSLPGASQVKIELFNLMGQKVKSLYNSSFPQGNNEVTIQPGNLASGEYFIVVNSDRFGKVQKKIHFIQ